MVGILKYINLDKNLWKKANLIMLVTIMFYIIYLGLGSSKVYASLTLPITENFETAGSDTSYQVITNNWRFQEKTGSLFWYRVATGDHTYVTDDSNVSSHSGGFIAKADIYSSAQGNTSLLYTNDSYSFPATGFCEFSFWMYHYPDVFTDTDGSVYGTAGAIYGAADSIQPQISINGGAWDNIIGSTEIKRVNGTTGWSR